MNVITYPCLGQDKTMFVIEASGINYISMLGLTLNHASWKLGPLNKMTNILQVTFSNAFREWKYAYCETIFTMDELTVSRSPKHFLVLQDSFRNYSRSMRWLAKSLIICLKRMTPPPRNGNFQWAIVPCLCYSSKFIHSVVVCVENRCEMKAKLISLTCEIVLIELKTA